MKHIKKSMFISTVLMVVMLIAALSTATFAWYTSNNSVTSTATYAGAAEAKTANIGIGFTSTSMRTTIEFDPLAKVTTNEQGVVTNVSGNLYPVAPVTFYSFEGMSNYQGYNAPADAYISNPSKTLTTDDGIIDTTPGNTADNLYLKRIINIETASDIKAKSSFIHNTAAETPIVTNLTAADFAGKYEKVYTTTAYAYNNAQTTAPAAGINYVTITDSKYTLYTSATDSNIGQSNLYKMTAAYLVVASDATTGQVNAIDAYQTYFNNQIYPDVGSYVIAYEVWGTKKFNEALNSKETFKGYAADAEGEVNDGDILNSAKAGTYSNLISEPVYDADGFSYVYKIYDAQKAGTVGTISSSNFSSFKFNTGSIDSSKAFKTGSVKNAQIGTLWTGNKGDGSKNYKTSGLPDLALVTGTKESTTGETVDTFYVYNGGQSTEANIGNIKVTLTVEDGIADLLRVAIFRDGKYYGTMANNLSGAATTFGPILENSKSTDMPAYTALNSINLGALDNQTSMAIQLVVWFDGGDLDANTAGGNCKFSLSFEA